MMLTRSTFLPRLLASASLLGICLLAPLAMAQGSGAKTSSDIEARYKLDVERCNTGQTNQDKATCLREAGAARDESRRHRLINGNESYQQNQTSRCQALPVAERGDCMLQMSGQDTKVEGSVGAGGVLRETTITIPGTPTPAPGAAPVTPAPGLTPNPPATVPAPSLAPTAPAVPGTTVTPTPGATQ
ncbi:MAG TPA: hypothetical protein VIR76_09060 [Pusillimonas sp.]